MCAYSFLSRVIPFRHFSSSRDVQMAPINVSPYFTIVYFIFYCPLGSLSPFPDRVWKFILWSMRHNWPKLPRKAQKTLTPQAAIFFFYVCSLLSIIVPFSIFRPYFNAQYSNKDFNSIRNVSTHISALLPVNCQ